MSRAARGSIPGVSRDTKSSAFLDLARALAAIAVLLGHTKVNLLASYGASRHANILITVFYAICTRGYQCVMVFFVLSGYLISASVIRAMREGHWSWRRYLIDRLTRLWVVLIPALFLTALWNYLSRLAFGVHTQNAGVVPFLGNMAFLQGIGVPSFGGNDPIWSLSYEFWYYILFPCLALTALSNTLLKRLVYGVAALAIIAFVGRTITLYFLVWLLGVIPMVLTSSEFAARCQRWRSFLLPLAMCLFVGVLFSRGVSDIQAFGYDFAVGATFTAVVCVLVFGFKETWQERHAVYPRTFGLLAGFSYTLYLSHYPVLHFIQLLFRGTRLEPTAHGLTLFSVIVAVALVYAWGVSRVTEAQTRKIRAFLIGRLVPGTPSATSVPSAIPRWKAESV